MRLTCSNAEAGSPIEKLKWRKICKQKWQVRKVAVAGHKRDAASIDKRCPNEDKALFRKRLLHRSVELAETIREGILRLSAAAQAKIVDAFRAG